MANLAPTVASTRWLPPGRFNVEMHYLAYGMRAIGVLVLVLIVPSSLAHQRANEIDKTCVRLCT